MRSFSDRGREGDCGAGPARRGPRLTASGTRPSTRRRSPGEHPVGTGAAGEQRGSGDGGRHRLRAEVDRADQAVAAGDREHPCGCVQPAQGALAELRQAAPQLEAFAVQVPEGTGVGQGPVGGVLGEPFGLRQPRPRVGHALAEAERGGVPRPGQRHAAAVPDVLAAAGAVEDRIGEDLVRQVEDLGKSELLALVDVGRAGQCEHQQSGGAGAGGSQAAAFHPGLARVAGDRTDLVVVVEHPGDGGAGAGDVAYRLGDRRAEGVGVPGCAEEVEEEGLVQFVGADVLGVFACGRHGDLADQQPLPAVPGGVLLAHRAPAAPHTVHLGPVPGQLVDGVAGALVGSGVVRVRQFGVLEQSGGDIDAEAVDTAVQPEAQHLLEVVADGRVTPVQVGLLGCEQVQVPLAGGAVGLLDAAPGGTAEHRAPVVGRLGPGRAAAGGEVETGALRAARRRGERGAEPRVLARTVVGDDVEQQLEPEAVGIGHEPVELGEVAVDGVDTAVVGDVVAVVVLRRRIERAEPDAVDAELAQVGESGPDAGQVADAVPGAVEEAADVDLVDHRVAPPGGRCGGGT